MGNKLVRPIVESPERERWILDEVVFEGESSKNQSPPTQTVKKYLSPSKPVLDDAFRVLSYDKKEGHQREPCESTADLHNFIHKEAIKRILFPLPDASLSERRETKQLEQNDVKDFNVSNVREQYEAEISMTSESIDNQKMPSYIQSVVNTSNRESEDEDISMSWIRNQYEARQELSNSQEEQSTDSINTDDEDISVSQTEKQYERDQEMSLESVDNKCQCDSQRIHPIDNTSLNNSHSRLETQSPDTTETDNEAISLSGNSNQYESRQEMTLESDNNMSISDCQEKRSIDSRATDDEDISLSWIRKQYKIGLMMPWETDEVESECDYREIPGVETPLNNESNKKQEKEGLETTETHDENISVSCIRKQDQEGQETISETDEEESCDSYVEYLMYEHWKEYQHEVSLGMSLESFPNVSTSYSQEEESSNSKERDDEYISMFATEKQYKTDQEMSLEYGDRKSECDCQKILHVENTSLTESHTTQESQSIDITETDSDDISISRIRNQFQEGQEKTSESGVEESYDSYVEYLMYEHWKEYQHEVSLGMSLESFPNVSTSYSQEEESSNSKERDDEYISMFATEKQYKTDQEMSLEYDDRKSECDCQKILHVENTSLTESHTTQESQSIDITETDSDDISISMIRNQFQEGQEKTSESGVEESYDSYVEYLMCEHWKKYQHEVSLGMSLESFPNVSTSYSQEEESSNSSDTDDEDISMLGTEKQYKTGQEMSLESDDNKSECDCQKILHVENTSLTESHTTQKSQSIDITETDSEDISMSLISNQSQEEQAATSESNEEEYYYNYPAILLYSPPKENSSHKLQRKTLKEPSESKNISTSWMGKQNEAGQQISDDSMESDQPEYEEEFIYKLPRIRSDPIDIPKRPRRKW